MMGAPAFRDFALLALDMREEQGIRGIGSERNRFLNHIAMAPFARKPLDEIRSVELRDWLRSMQQKPAGDTRGARLLDDETVKRAYALVRSIFGCAVEREVIETTPCTGVRLKKRVNESATKEKWTWLTFAEQRRLAACEAIPAMDRYMIRFAMGTGLRQAELSNLELRDLHAGPDNPHVFVRYGSRHPKTGAKRPPKNGKTRRVPLFGDALVAAKHWLYGLSEYAPENPEGLVFPTPRGRIRPIGKPLGGGGKLRKYLALVDITRRVRWHDLRHTFCSSLIAGVWGPKWTLEEIRPVAGHSSILITQRYAHLSDEDLARTAGMTSFSHDAAMPLAQALNGGVPREAQPIDADDFAAAGWGEAVAS